jgi:hypothetical protein
MLVNNLCQLARVAVTEVLRMELLGVNVLACVVEGARLAGLHRLRCGPSPQEPHGLTPFIAPDGYVREWGCAWPAWATQVHSSTQAIAPVQPL